MKVSIVVPAHNEEQNIRDVVCTIEQCMEVPYELIVVNDHSTDRTAKILADLVTERRTMKVIDNSLEKGFANALQEGFRCSSGEAIIPVMGDLCDDLSTISVMVRAMESGYDIVCGSRYCEGGKRIGGSRLKGFLSRMAGRSARFILNVPTSDITNAFKLYKRNVLEHITITSSGFEISMEVVLKAYFLGYRITEVPTVWRERTKGQSSFKVMRLLPRYVKLYAWALAQKMQGR